MTEVRPKSIYIFTLDSPLYSINKYDSDKVPGRHAQPKFSKWCMK